MSSPATLDSFKDNTQLSMTNNNLFTFIVICFIFIISAIAYINSTRAVYDPDMNEDTKQTVQQTQNLLFWILFLTGICMFLFGYMIIYNPTTNDNRYTGAETCSSACSSVGDGEQVGVLSDYDE